jgi:hypothetical protein
MDGVAVSQRACTEHLPSVRGARAQKRYAVHATLPPSGRSTATEITAATRKSI